MSSDVLDYTKPKSNKPRFNGFYVLFVWLGTLLLGPFAMEKDQIHGGGICLGRLSAYDLLIFEFRLHPRFHQLRSRTHRVCHLCAHQTFDMSMRGSLQNG